MKSLSLEGVIFLDTIDTVIWKLGDAAGSHLGAVVDVAQYLKCLCLYAVKLVVKLGQHEWFGIRSEMVIPERLVLMHNLRTEAKAC